MTEDSTSVPLDGFLHEAGKSLTDAQAGLVGPSPDAPLAVAISEAELDVRATVERDALGTMRVRPVSIADARVGVAPGALSSIRVRYVAVGSSPGADGPEPRRSAEEVTKEVVSRGDVVRLQEILGELQTSATFLRPQQRWLVTVQDADGRLVRELFVADTPGR